MVDDMNVYGYYDDPNEVQVDGPAVAPKGRAKLSSHLPIRFTPAVLDAARKFAAEDGVSVSTWVRVLVEREVLRRTPSTTQAAPAVLMYHPDEAPSRTKSQGAPVLA